VISYLVDVRKGLLKPVTNLANFALYMAYFPRLLAGPIERARDFMGQLESPRSIDHHQIANSLMLMMVGLVRKIALADSMFLFLPEDIFSDPGKYTSPQLVLWLLVYAFALYNDFAGYTSIARGVSGLFGLRLSRNFSTPYFSESFTQFWLRWHATLSSWMRNYIFMPITRKLLRRKGHSSTVILSILPTVTTMIFTAIWHELSWNMLVWGGLHAVYLLLERLISGVTKSSKGIRAGFKKAGTILIVFILTALAWVPFRMSMPIALKYWGGLFKLSEWRLQMPSLILQPVHLIPLGLVCITLFADYLQNRGGEMVFREIKPLYKALLLNGAVILLLLAYFSQAEVPPPFIYQGF